MRLGLQRNRLPDYPVVPLKETVVFPHTVAPVLSGRRGTITAVEDAMAHERTVVLCIRKNDESTDPEPRDLMRVGTIATILQIVKLPDGSLRLLVEGKQRCRITGFVTEREHLRARVEPIAQAWTADAEAHRSMRTLRDSFGRFAALHKKVPPEVSVTVARTEEPHKLVDVICGHSTIPTDKKIELLAEESVIRRLQELTVALEAECEVLDLKKQINSRVRKRLEKGQRDYFLNEQMKEIHRELGRDDDDPSGAADIARRIEEGELPEPVAARARKEADRLKKLQPISPEAGIVRTYLDWLLDLPWNRRSSDEVDLAHAAKILDADHYDMEKPKERILDYIAVRQLTERLRGPILCFVGPPGTGKTSLGQSLARCLSRGFVRISLGGVRDEAEIRGHRRTYVGAMPGKIIQSMRKVGTCNPVFLLDEIDKIGADFRGDPASALLEVLDPEQNAAFVDHYLEVPFDLSEVIFITTANSLHTIPHALRDRMEVIEIPGYTEYEKKKIAEAFLIPKQLEANGLSWLDVRFRSDAITTVIRDYTMESGVRNLDREIAAVVRKIAREVVAKGFRPPVSVHAAGTGDDVDANSRGEPVAAVATGPRSDVPPLLKPNRPTSPGDPGTDGLASVVDAQPHDEPAAIPAAQIAGQHDSDDATHASVAEETRISVPRIEGIATYRPFRRVVTARTVTRSLGKRRFRNDLLYRETRVGVVNGLAWTEMGGRTLPIEVAVFSGTGSLRLTGSMGDVMKESAQAAFSFIRSFSHRFRLPKEFFADKDIHIHVPEGAIPKDGPSAGISMTAAMVSAFSGIAVQPDFAMTGEITLTGRVLQIGGVKEKVLAAHRGGIRNILLPEANRVDTEELPSEVTSDITFHFAASIMDGLRILFPADLFEIRAW
ncbi:MAG: endopeptidase La [Spirochaetaceae bacterium]|nr:MAG: endopeptidase La [Spirochaetaceae bacterium]